MTEAHFLADTFLHDPDIRTALAGDGGEVRVAFDCEEFSTGLESAMEIASVNTPVPGPYLTTELRFSQSSNSTMILASSIELGAMAPTFPLLRRKALKESAFSDIEKNREIYA